MQHGEIGAKGWSLPWFDGGFGSTAARPTLSIFILEAYIINVTELKTGLLFVRAVDKLLLVVKENEAA